MWEKKAKKKEELNKLNLNKININNNALAYVKKKYMKSMLFKNISDLELLSDFGIQSKCLVENSFLIIRKRANIK